MFDWIVRNHQLLGVILNGAMLAVWIVYLQIFASSYRSQVRANILINMAGGPGLSARCLVSNMSAGPIYVYSILVDVELPGRALSGSVTETDGIEEWEKPTDLNLWTRQGPLENGEVRDMGSFEVMLDHALRSDAGGRQPPAGLHDAIRAFQVRIIAIYGSEDLPIAAERRFIILRRPSGAVLSPTTPEAHQVRSTRRRRKIRRALKAEIAAAHR